MSIKTKFIIIFGIIFILYGISDYCMDRFIILPEFDFLERAQAKKDLERSLNAIKREIDYMNQLCWDWAAWDDMYDYVESRSQQFLDNNLAWNTFLDNKLNLIQIYDKEGKLVWGRTYDPNLKHPIFISDFPQKQILYTQDPHVKDLGRLHLAGVVNLDQGPIIVSIRPIVTTENKGPIHGTLIMGRFITQHLLNSLTEQTQVDFEIFPTNNLPESLKIIPPLIPEEIGYLITEGENGIKLVHHVYKDIFRKPAFMVKVNFPPLILQKGQSSIQLSVFSGLATGFILLLLIFSFLEYSVFNHIDTLKKHVLKVRETGDFSARTAMNRNDEIGTLAKEFDQMMEMMENQNLQLEQMNADLKNDVERRIQIEKALKESESRYRSFIENFPGIAFRATLNVDPYFLHGDVEEVTGYSEEDFLTLRLRWRDLIHPDEWPIITPEREKLLTVPGYYSEIEYRIIHKTGEERSVKHFIRSVLNEDTGERYLEGLIYDITDRARAEMEVRHRERYYRSLLHSLHDEIMVVDGDFRVIDTNKFFMSTIGRRRDKVINQFCYQIFHDTDKPCTRCTEKGGILDSLKRNESVGYRYLHTLPDGAQKWLDINMAPLAEESGRNRMIMAMRDITREVQLESQLLQKQKMEAIGTLAGGIAHDFNNMLMSIMLNVEYALLKVKEEPAIREGLEISLKSAHRAKDLVNQILTFSRKTETELNPLHVSPIIKEALKMLRASLPSNIKIELDIQAEDAVIIAAPTFIHQVIVNLCTNAAHAMQENGGNLKVTLSTESTVPVEMEKPAASYVKIAVSDTGKGIDAEIMDKIFDPFFTTKKVGEGTGMGLSVVHGIIERLNGKIRIDSSPDKGALVEVYIPGIDPTPKISSPETQSPTHTKGSGRVLIVDDESHLLISLYRSLTELDYQVTSAANGHEALEKFMNNPNEFDIVITDQTMPDISGVNLAQKIMSLRPGIPIILYTGFSETIDEATALQHGVTQFVRKPVTAMEISEIIKKLI